MRSTTLLSQRVVTPAGVLPAAVTVAGARITAVTPLSAHAPSAGDVDLGAVALLPGMVDLDARVAGPAARLSHSYAELAMAAVRGGVTTVVVAPAPADPPILEPAALRAHVRAAAQVRGPNFLYLGGVGAGSSPADLAELRAAGVVGLYASLGDGGAPDLVAIPDALLHKAMAEAVALDLPVLVHAEDETECLASTATDALARRPSRAERRGVERVLAAARVTGARAHLTPFTAAECAALLAAGRTSGIRVSAQTNPHYLCLPAEGVPDAGYHLGCRPPLRSAANRSALWTALLAAATEPAPASASADAVAGVRHTGLTTVGSGHRPASGLRAIEWALPALWTAARRRGQDLWEVSQWTAQQPAAIIGREHRAGRIAPGYDADLVAFDPEGVCQVPDAAVGLYAGRQLRGRVVRTWVAGRPHT